jgi:hypothetical protein
LFFWQVLLLWYAFDLRATYSLSDGAMIIGIGDGTFSRTNRIIGGVSVWNEDGSRSDEGY